jgi:small subunit ribosomal protein S2
MHFLRMTTTQFTPIPYEDMLKAGMHFGRRKTVFHPATKSYVFTVRDGICIIDLLKTQEQLEKAVVALKDVISAGGLILFVAPTKQSYESVKALAEKLGMPYVVDRWLGGILTNFKVINSRVRKLESMEQEQASGTWDKYNKKERLMLERELVTMRKNFDGLKKLIRIPDIVFVASLKEGGLPIAESKKMGVKTVGIVNTDADPKLLNFAIPGNDRSKMAVDLIIQALSNELTS